MDRSKSDLYMCIKLEPSNQAVRETYERLKQQRNKNRVRETDIQHKMMGKYTSNTQHNLSSEEENEWKDPIRPGTLREEKKNKRHIPKFTIPGQNFISLFPMLLLTRFILPIR